MPAEKEPVVEKPVEAPKDTDRQLSKKELKKKELAELEAVLAELGYPTSEASGQEGSRGEHYKIYVASTYVIMCLFCIMVIAFNSFCNFLLLFFFRVE